MSARFPVRLRRMAALAAVALLCAAVIATVTFIICLAGLLLGRRFGMKLAGKAGILGGVILIAIGLEIFITGVA